MPALAFPTRVTWDESFLLLSEPLFLYLQNGDDNITRGELNEIHRPQSSRRSGGLPRATRQQLLLL